MQRTFFRPDAPDAVPNSPPLYPDDLEGAIQDTLATLADIDCAYDERRSALWEWSGPQADKMRLLGEVDSLHRQEREPYVKRLAELHGRMVSMTLFRTKH
jgi:hypothetical protein